MYLKKYNLKGKYSLVTGAGKGLGRACAIALAEAGSNLILISRTQKDLDSVSKIAKKYKVKSKTYVCDLTNYMKLKKIVEEQKKIDVLINNAGTNIPEHFLKIRKQDMEKVVKINTIAAFNVANLVANKMIQAKNRKKTGAAIVNMSSLAAQRGFSPKMKEEFGTTAPSYYVAKAGIDALTRYMAGVGGDKNIRVNCIRPGQIMTPGATRGTLSDPDGGHHVFESMFDLAQIIPGPGYPKDVANLVLFLVSENSRFITSEIINIDGGVAAKI